MPNAHVAAAATGLPAACPALETVRDCELVYAALQDALAAVTGIMLRPICDDEGRAYAHLDAVSDWLMAEADRVVALVEAMTPQTRTVADDRAQLILRHEINSGSPAADLATKAASLAAECSRVPLSRH